MARNDLLQSLRAALSHVARAGLRLSVLLLIGIAVLIAGQVLMRNVFAVGLPWADEAARWAGISLVYLTIPHLLDRGSHIAVELLPERLEGRAQTLVRAFSELCVAAFAGLSLYAFAAFLERAANFRTPALGIPNWIFYMPALIGMALLGLVALLRLANLLRERSA